MPSPLTDRFPVLRLLLMALLLTVLALPAQGKRLRA